jgi:hypothetical protein
LFRLQTADEIHDRVQFHNTGPDQVPGMIVMSIDDRDGENLDENYDYIIVVFNASNEEQTIELDDEFSQELALHPVQAESADAVLQGAVYDREDNSITVPAMTTVVFAAEELPEEETPEPEEESNIILLLIVAAVVLLLSVGAWLLLRSRGGAA